ncbi:hypothetical protein N8150_01375 [Gammaproteobacteria bacterium]|nr:hypothetical protein [Gammaproteobacteria bacterium]
MGKKRFFDDRLKYLSFIQNTGEKRAISKELYPHIASLPQNKTYLRILDAGTGDGTIKSNLIKSFHKYHPYTSLLITGKEISYEDLKNTLEKMPDRFVEHPNLMVTMTNVKFSELGHIENSKKMNGKNIKKITLVLKNDNSFDFNDQISNLGNFIKKYWGIEIDSKSRTSYSNPCLIRIYREDHKRYLEPFIDKDYDNNNYDLIVASQAYRAISNAKTKVSNVIAPLMRLLNKSGKLLITHSCGDDSVEKILRIAWKDKDPFPTKGKEIIQHLNDHPVGENSRYTYSKPKSYSFKFKRTPDQTVSELFGHGIDAKLANILYVGQIPEKDIQAMEKNSTLLRKIHNAIAKEDKIFFRNELFSIKKIS